MRRLVACFVAVHFLFFFGAVVAEAKVVAVGAIDMTVSDMERSVAFYRDVLTFRKVSDHEFANDAFDRLEHVFGARVRIVDLRLGHETLRLTQYFTPQGRPVPLDSRSNDLWFQHVAIVVSDMDAAFARLDRNHVLDVSSFPQTLPAWNRAAAGIRAFYFRDPDNHVLEVIYFPPGKGRPFWRRNDGLFLGIDHTAVAVSDTERSLRFYRDKLGFRVVGRSENYGLEQERLNGVRRSRVRITSLRTQDGPGIELLEYLAPSGGRPYPSDERSCDLVHWQTVLIDSPDTDLSGDPVNISGLSLGGKKALLVRDPDGHVLQMTEQ
jgi:catechol 2,3-dioxygenase-like lactoylglutathione lyase family enzyme